MFNKLSRDKHLSKNRFVTTDVFLKEFKSYIYEKTQSRMATSYTNRIKDLFDKIIDCKQIYKKHEFDIVYRDFILLPPHKLKGNKRRYSMNHHNDTLSWLAIMDYCKKKSETCEYVVLSNDSDFFSEKNFLVDEFYSYTKKKIIFETFFL